MVAESEELLGQRELMARLLSAAAAEHLHHCYVFEGPPSVGKGTAALRLAMAAACTAEQLRPCGVCKDCRLIRAGNHPDVIQVVPDPERKTRIIGVDQVREVTRQVRLRRYMARWRTVIIDPADAMNPQAANALLKTLEEPPPGTGFILVTSRVSSMLPTVLSRSQRVRFRAVSEDELVPWLEARGIAEARRVARRSMGCPGRALELSGGALAESDAVRDQLLTALSGGPSHILDLAEKLSKGGEGREKLDGVLDALDGLLRDATLCAAGRGEHAMHEDRRVVVEAWGAALWPTGIARLESALDEARTRMSLNVNARLIAESLLARVGTELGAARKVQ